jgi:hypothetical protein
MQNRQNKANNGARGENFGIREGDKYHLQRERRMK